MKIAKMIRLVMGLTAIVLVGQPDHAQSQRTLMYALRQCNEYPYRFLSEDPDVFHVVMGMWSPRAGAATSLSGLAHGEAMRVAEP